LTYRGSLCRRKRKRETCIEVSFVHEQQHTGRMAAENRRLLDELLGRDG
jgi:hypothetical protein